MTDKLTITIAMASPSDVREEREAVVEVVSEINSVFKAMGFPIILDLSRWETDSRPGMHPLGPQGRIDDLVDFKSKDIVLGIFGERLGTPVHDAVSGTAHELLDAIKRWKENGAPQVMLYFRQVENGVPVDNVQFEALGAFKRELQQEGAPLYETYATLDNFRSRVKDALLAESMTISGLRTASGLVLNVEITPTVLRSEGFTELLGPLIIRCRTAGTQPDHVPVFFSIIIYLNTAVTCRLIPPQSFFFSIPSLDAVLVEVGRSSPQAVIRGRFLGGNAILFDGIPIHGILPDETRVFQITNLRCNANGIGSRDGEPAKVVVSVTATSAIVKAKALPMANASWGVNVLLRDAAGELPLAADGFPITQSAGLEFAAVATINFKEGFSGAFKTRANQNPVWSESAQYCILDQHADGSISNYGAADAGTQLHATFCEIPSGLRLFVPTKYISAAVRAELVPEHSSIRVHNDEAASSLGLVEVAVSPDRSFATVVWEIRDRAANHAEVDVVVYATCAPGTACGTVSLVAGFYPGPSSGRFSGTKGSMAAADLPVPRFGHGPHPYLRVIAVTPDRP